MILQARLFNILKSTSYCDAIIKKTYKNRVEYTICNSFVEGLEYDNKKSSEEEVVRVSTSRIKSKIKDYCECNNFEYFFTQTLIENRDDLETFKKNIQKKFKAYKRINKNFIYLIIFEKHKDGCYHLHGVVGGLGSDVYINDNFYLSLKFFEDLGYNSLSRIKNIFKISNYITKYITKDLIKTESGYSYFHSKNLNVPIREKVKYIPVNAELIFENDYIKKWVVKK